MTTEIKKTKTCPTPRQSGNQEETKHGPQGVFVMDIDINLIDTDNQMVRASIDDDHVIELASSLSHHGLLEPIVLERGKLDRYNLVAGFHRLAAASRLGWQKISANIRTHSEETPIKSLALVENICRKGMTLSEEVEAVAHLNDVEKKSASQICQLIGKSRAWVDRRLALPHLDEEVAGAAFAGLITLGMAETISLVEDQGIRRQILNEAVYGKRTLGQIKDLINLYAETPTMENAIAEGLDTAQQLQAQTSPTKPCAACGNNRPLLQLVNIWVCGDGCSTDSQSEGGHKQNIPRRK